MEDQIWFQSSFKPLQGYSDETTNIRTTSLKGNKAVEDEPCDPYNFSCSSSHDRTTENSSHYHSQNPQEQDDFKIVCDYDDVLPSFDYFDEKTNFDEHSPRNPSKRPLNEAEGSEDPNRRESQAEAYEDANMLEEKDIAEWSQNQMVLQACHAVEQSENIFQSDSDSDLGESPTKRMCNSTNTSREVQECISVPSQNVYPSEKQLENQFNDIGDSIIFEGNTGQTLVSIAGRKEAVMPKAPKKRKITSPVSDKRPDRNYLRLFISGIQKMISEGKIGSFLDNWAHWGIVTKQDILTSLKESSKAATSCKALKANVFVDKETRNSILLEDILKLAKLKLAEEFVVKENYEWWVYNAYAPFNFECNHKTYEENENEKRMKRQTFLQKRELKCKQFLSCFKGDAEFDT